MLIGYQHKTDNLGLHLSEILALGLMSILQLILIGYHCDPRPIPLDAPVTMATRFLVVVLVFIELQLGRIPDK